MKYLVQWMILTNYQIIHGVLEWIVSKKVTDYGQNVTLFCNVSNCCPKLAGWDRWTPSQRTLYIDVKTGRPNKKYDGKVLKDGYTLVIQNLTKEDLNVSYSCLYGITLGERKFLQEEDVFMDMITINPESASGNNRFSDGEIAGIVLGLVVPVAVTFLFAIIYFSKRRKKRHSKGIESADENEDMPLISTDPSPPQGLKAEVEMIGIRLTWDPPSCQVSKYQIERITDGHKDLMDSSAEETSHLISDVFPSQMYYFAIKLCCTLFDKNCESKFSNHITCKAGDPLPPHDLKATAGVNGIYLTWNPPLYPTFAHVSKYEIERTVNGHRDLMILSADKTSHLMSDVFPSQMYSFAIKTCCTTLNKIYDSTFSDTIECKAEEPLPPNHLKAASDFEGIHITWSIPEYPVIDKIHHFILEVNREIINVAPDKTCWIISNVYPSTNYTIRMATSARSGMENKSDCNRSSRFQTESEYTEKLKCKSDICEETKVKEEKKNFLRLEKLFQMTNSAVIKKIEDKISDTNLEITHLDTAEHFLSSLSKDQKESICCTTDNCDTKSSIDYDLVLLLRFWLSSNGHEVPTMQFDNLPAIDDKSIQADLSRIFLTMKRYQNYPSKLISATEFKELKYVYMAVGRLCGSKLEEKDSQVFRQKSIVNDENNGNQDTLEAVLQDKEAQSNEPYRCSCLDLHKLEVRTWKKMTDNFKITGVIGDLQKQFEVSSCVTLVGTENEEVNAFLHHIALTFVEQNDFYVITPCKSPVEIVQHFKLERHQLFVLEDACGRLFPVQESVQYFIEHDSSFKQMLQAGKTKIIISFTASVYWKTNFSKADSFFSKFIRDLAPEYSSQFGPQQTVNTVKFETTWKEQLDDWFLNDKLNHCALFAITIRNGCISTSCFKQQEIQKETDDIQQILKTYELDYVQVGASLFDHPGNYVSKDGDQYKISNSIMFNFLCCYFCAHKDLQNLFLQLVDGKVFYGKLVLQCAQEKFGEDFISVNNSQEERYFRRILHDVTRKDYNVFYSRQMQVPVFRQKLIAQFTKMDGEWIIGMINTKELQEIAITGRFQGSPLAIACSQGYEEIVSFMLRHVEKSIKDKIVSALFRITVGQGYPLSVVRLMIRSNANVNIVWDDSWTALTAACQRGNHEIANFLINAGSNIDTVDALGTTPLMLACYTGLYETVQLLIKKGVDINTLNKSKMSALKYACISGHENIVSLLLDDKAYTSAVYEDGRTPLVIAFEERHDRIISLLKNKGFEVDMKDTTGKTALAIACISGEIGTVQSLIKLGASLNSRDNEGWMPLSRACKRGAENIVEVLINQTTDLNLADNDGWTPLKKASLYGHSKVVDMLLNTHRLEIDKADNKGWTPLMSCCQQGHVKVAELLIGKNADVNHSSNDGMTPLMTAIQNEHIKVINLLLKKRIDVDKSDKKGYTPLKIACKNGYHKISSLLIDAGAKVNRKDKDGWTPLKTACKEGHLKICTLLLSHEADINIPDLRGWTPLKTAAANGHTEIVECLLKKGVILDIHDNDGWTELMSACQFGYEKIAKLLVENGSCVNHQSVKKLTPLIAACQNNKSKVVTFLIKNGANVNEFDVDGWTPLHFTCMNGHIKASEILIQNEVDVNISDRKGWTPLKIACRNKKAGLVEILINAKADVNLIDNDGWTPLKTACRAGDEDTVDLLLKFDVDINKEDKEGWTPLKSASVNGHHQIVTKLLQKKADIEKVDQEGWTALMSACKAGKNKVISVLLEDGADCNYYSKSTGDTPLIIACTYSDVEIIELLLKKGANWKMQNHIGQTSLLVACMYGKTKNVSKLLDYKVDIDVTDKNSVSPLKAACQGMYIEIIEILLKAGANVDIVDENGYTPLLCACEKQNHQLVKLLIRYKADVNQCSSDGWDPYLIAIKNKNEEIVNSLIEYGADKSKASLLKACEIGHLPIIQFLLDQGRSVESKEEGVMTPLKMVIEKRQFVILDLFIKKGRTFELDHLMLKDLIDAFDEEGLSALGKACRDANTETLMYLLEHKANIFQTEKRGISPLVYACLNGNKHNVDLLLEELKKVVDDNRKIVLDSCRSYLNKSDNDGYTPLTAAASRGHVPLIELLISNGTDVDKLDDCGKAPIMYACEKGDLHTVKSLVSNGASITIISEKTCSPFTLTKRANAWQIVDYFIEMGIRLNHEDLLSISTIESGNEKRNGNDFFTMACKNGYRALVELIINEKQADLNSPDCEGLTPLMHACKMNQTKIVEVIVKNGIDIDSESSEGKTGLMFACFEGYTDIAEILLKNHATVNKSDNSGLTSLMVACQKGSLSCVKLLTKYGADMDIKSSALVSAFKIACYTENYEIVDHLVSQESYKPLKYDVRKLLDRTHNNWKELIRSVCKGGYESLFNILIESEAEIEAVDGDGNSLLMLASQGGHDGIIENLVTRRANINHKNQIGQTALRMACNGGLARSVKILLKNDAHPNKTDAEGRTPLMIVSQGGCLDVVELLIQHHADINMGDRRGTTALMLAAKLGQYDTAAYLVTKGADISKCDNKGLNSLMAACQNGHIAIVHLIAKSKIDINSNDNDGFTALRFACDGGHNDIADFLIQNKAEVDKADNRCWTPLKSSCFIGTFSTVELLLEKNADVNKQDKEGWTPLMSACQNGHDNIAELLLNWKAGIDMTEVDGWTALRIACINGKASTVKFLVSKGADVNKVDKQGWSPLKGACVGDLKNKLSSGLKFAKIVGLPKECETESSFDLITSKKYEEIVTCLIQNDADVNLVDTDGWTCLMSACQSGHIDIVNLLFSNIIDIDKANSNGSTALSIACSMGHTKVAVLLLTHGADINKANSDGWTPLKIACQVGNKDTVNMLLRNEANVNIEDKDGRTALMSACKNGNREIVQSLLESKADVEYIAHDGSTTPIKIARKFGHRRVERLLKRALKGSINDGGDEEDDQEDDEDDEESNRRRIGRISLPFQLNFSNDIDEDDDDDFNNLPPGILESMLENDDLNSDNSLGCRVS